MSTINVQCNNWRNSDVFQFGIVQSINFIVNAQFNRRARLLLRERVARLTLPTTIYNRPLKTIRNELEQSLRFICRGLLCFLRDMVALSGDQQSAWWDRWSGLVLLFSASSPTPPHPPHHHHHHHHRLLLRRGAPTSDRGNPHDSPCTLISSSTTAHNGLPVAESACLSQPSFSASQNVLLFFFLPHLPSSFPANVIPSQGAPPPRSLTRVLASTVASLQKSNVHK